MGCSISRVWRTGFLVVFLVAVPAWAALGALLDDPSLERNLVAMEMRFAHLDDEYEVYEGLIDRFVSTAHVEELTAQYREIAFMLRVSLAQPFAYRHLYNEMFDLHQRVAAQLEVVDVILSEAVNNLEVIEESQDEFSDLPMDRISPRAREAISKLGDQFGVLDKRMRRWMERMTPFRVQLQDLYADINKDLDQLQSTIPTWLATFLFKTDNHLFQYQTWVILPVSLAAWADSLGYTVLAKLPDSPRRLRDFAILFVLMAAAGFAVAWLAWRRWIRSRLSGRSEVRRNLAVGGAALLTALAMSQATTVLAFPGRMSCLGIFSLLVAYGVCRLAWGLRGLCVPIGMRSPLVPMLLMFILARVLEFVNMPLGLAGVGWPVVCLIAAWACRRLARQAGPPLERRLCQISVVLYVALAGACLAGLVFLALFLAKAWFVALVVLQFGVALARLIKDTFIARYAGAGRFGLSMLAGLSLPLLWMLLVVGFFVWAVEQFGEIELLARSIELGKAASILFTLMVILFVDRLLASVLVFYGTYPASRKRPIKGYVQLGKLFVFIVGTIVLVCLFINKSPWGILGGIGAMTAVLMFVFKDTIQALVASIQIVADDLVRIGDWIELDSQQVDGDVMDVTLHTIKVRNFDMTISTVPTYKLISESFKNWRGMCEAGGRRIKRILLIDQSTIRFLDKNDLARLGEVDLLAEYFRDNLVPTPPDNPREAMRDHKALNQPQLTNIGAFRAYAAAYLHHHPLIRQDLTFLIRYLNPTIDGLPLEIYVFAADTHWPTYESIQADVLDHLEASLPLFQLRIAQRPGYPHDPIPRLAGE